MFGEDSAKRNFGDPHDIFLQIASWCRLGFENFMTSACLDESWSRRDSGL